MENSALILAIVGLFLTAGLQAYQLWLIHHKVLPVLEPLVIPPNPTTNGSKK